MRSHDPSPTRSEDDWERGGSPAWQIGLTHRVSVSLDRKSSGCVRISIIPRFMLQRIQRTRHDGCLGGGTYRARRSRMVLAAHSLGSGSKAGPRHPPRPDILVVHAFVLGVVCPTDDSKATPLVSHR